MDKTRKTKDNKSRGRAIYSFHQLSIIWFIQCLLEVSHCCWCWGQSSKERRPDPVFDVCSIAGKENFSLV